MPEDSQAGWTPASPAAEDVVAELQRRIPRLPAEYLAFLRRSNGGEGELPVQPLWFVIWPAEQVADNNRRYEVPHHLPGFIAFGSSGGGELLAFDTRHEVFRIVAIPFIPLDAGLALPVAESFAVFEGLMGVAEATEESQ